jgi:hypothetical protein
VTDDRSLGDIVAAFSAPVEDILLAHLKVAWPYLSLDDQKRWYIETDYSKNPRGASQDLIDTVQRISDFAQWEEGYGDYNRFMRTPPRSHNGAPYWYEYSTFERCAQQIELAFDCPLGRPPRRQSPGKPLTKVVGVNGPAWREQDYCAYIVEHEPWLHFASERCLVIQQNERSHVEIKLRDDVSNEEALRLGQALLRAVAAPPEPWDGD